MAAEKPENLEADVKISLYYELANGLKCPDFVEEQD
jgi:hypothetical protein